MVKYLKFERMCIDVICTCAPAKRNVEWIFSEQREIEWLDDLINLDELVIKEMRNWAACTQGNAEECICAREDLILESSLPEADRPHPHLPTYEEKDQALRELDEERDKCPICAEIKYRYKHNKLVK